MLPYCANLHSMQDIDCMPLNPLENMATSLARHTIAVDKFLENFNKLKMNGHTKNQRPEGYIKFSPGEILENFDAESLMTLSAYPMHNLLKQEKVRSSFFALLFSNIFLHIKKVSDYLLAD